MSREAETLSTRIALASAALAAALLLGPAVGRCEILGPLETRSARCGELDLRVVAGAALALQEDRLFFDQRRDRFDLPHLQAEISVARRLAVELDYNLWLQRFHEPATPLEPVEDGYGSGDLRVRTRLAILLEGAWSPAVAVQLGVKLPNARARTGFGTNETDAEGGLLISKAIGPLEVHGNVALGILGDPKKRAAQDDVMLASFLLVVRPAPPLRLLAEVWAMPPSAANQPRAVLRGGAGVQLGVVDLGLVAGVGMTSSSPRFVAGLDVGFQGSLVAAEGAP